MVNRCVPSVDHLSAVTDQEDLGKTGKFDERTEAVTGFESGQECPITAPF